MATEQDSSSVSIPELLRRLRSDIEAAQASAGEDPLLEFERAELEVMVSIEESSTKKGGIDFKVFSGDLAKAETVGAIHTLKLIVKPYVDEKGTPRKIAIAGDASPN